MNPAYYALDRCVNNQDPETCGSCPYASDPACGDPCEYQLAAAILPVLDAIVLPEAEYYASSIRRFLDCVSCSDSCEYYAQCGEENISSFLRLVHSFLKEHVHAAQE